MHKKRRSIYQSILIVVLAIFVSVPCSSKRELKQYFGIPTNASLAKPVSNCTAANTITRQSSVHNLSVFQTRLPYFDFGNTFTWSAYDLLHKPFFPEIFVRKTPVYLLHRRLLI